MHDLLRRQAAVERTRARFHRTGFSWGKADCIRMARFHLVALGHRPPRVPAYQTAAGAIRALRKAGFADLPSLFDTMLPRIAPASRLPGDFILLQGEHGLHSVTIADVEKVFGWHPDAPHFAPMTPLEIEGAWRV